MAEYRVTVDEIAGGGGCSESCLCAIGCLFVYLLFFGGIGAGATAGINLFKVNRRIKSKK